MGFGVFAMKQLWITVAGAALILLSAQSWLAWDSRDDHLELARAGAQIDACSQIAAAAADFQTWARLGRREMRERGALRESTHDVLRDKPRELIRAVEVGRYILPDDPFAPYLAEMKDATEKTTPAIFVGELDRADDLLADFDGAAKAAQSACAELVSR